MYDPYTARHAPNSTTPFAGEGDVAADVAAGLLEESARYLRGRFELGDAIEYATDALYLLNSPSTYIVATEGYDEPELFGPFASEHEASEWGRDNLGFQTFWTTDVRRATEPTEEDV